MHYLQETGKLENAVLKDARAYVCGCIHIPFPSSASGHITLAIHMVLINVYENTLLCVVVTSDAG